MTSKLAPGETVVPFVVSVKRMNGVWDDRLILAPEGSTAVVGTLELWDRAPLSAAPEGYCDPWWARAVETGTWWIVARPRKSSERKRGPEPVAYYVDKEVRLRLQAYRGFASPVIRQTLKAAGYGKAAFRWQQDSDPVAALLRAPIVERGVRTP